jgi:hypothetical protein
VVSFLSWLGVAAAIVGGLVVGAYLFWPTHED